MSPLVARALIGAAAGAGATFALGSVLKRFGRDPVTAKVSPADIARIVSPCLVDPWRERVAAAKTLPEMRRLHEQMSTVRVLDPACGCGNFLYVAYRELRRVERELIDKMEERDRVGGGGQAVRDGLVGDGDGQGSELGTGRGRVHYATVTYGSVGFLRVG